MPVWNTASEIDLWAQSIAARALLPQLLRQLVFATVERVNLQHLNFPAGDESQRKGYDGQTQTDLASTFVPQGYCIWELGCREDAESKADEDYEKRLENPVDDLSKITYIAVSARDWNGADKWAKKKSEHGKFKKVLAYDSNILEQWLSDAPAVGLWFAQERGASLAGVTDVENYLKNVLATLKHPIPPQLFLTNREETTKKLSSWAEGDQNALAIFSPSPTESIDVFSAWVHSLPSEKADLISSRTVIVDNAETWKALAPSKQKLILVVGPSLQSSPELLACAKRQNHKILRHASFTETKNDNVIELERIRTEDLKDALHKSGIEERYAAQLAEGSGGTVTVLRRLLANDLGYSSPEWSKADVGASLVPLLFAAAWQDSNSDDRDALSKLANTPYSEVEKVAIRWRSVPDAPIRRVLDFWEFNSPHDAWILLCPYISPSALKSFEEVAVTVLGEDDPALDLPPEERFMAEVKGKKRRFSQAIRRGISEVLALGAGLEVAADDHNFAGRARLVLRKILPAQCGWKRWASLGRLLPLLAEAAPEEFLEIVDADLNTQIPQLIELMRQEHNEGIAGANYHSGLLWALENIAWNPKYVSRVALLFAKLDELDPGGKWANRPGASLRSLFFSWRPQTMATVDQRLAILESLMSKVPSASWKLLLALLPNNHETIMDNHKPSLRNWASGWTGNVVGKDYSRYVSGIVNLAVNAALSSAVRIPTLVRQCMALPANDLSRVFDQIEEIDLGTISDADRFSIWNAFRAIVEQYAEFQDSLRSPDEIERMVLLRDRFTPKDKVQTSVYLFDDVWPRNFRRNLSFEEQQVELLKSRSDAVDQIWTLGGLPYVLKLACESKHGELVGFSLGKTHGAEPQSQILPDLLTSDEKKRVEFSLGYTAARIHSEGRDWVEKLPGPDWTIDQIEVLSRAMPFDRRTWQWVAGRDAALEARYWASANIWSSQLEVSEYVFAIEKLIAAKRTGDAAHLLGAVLYNQPAFPPEFFLRVLRAVASAGEQELRGLDAHHIGKIFECAQKDPQTDQSELAKLEFAFLPVIGKHHLRPLALERSLSSDPMFFVECLKLIYRPHHQDKKTAGELDPQEKAKGQACWHLLHNWERIPGTQEDGSISTSELIDWVKVAREEAQKLDRIEVCDINLGQLFAHSKEDKDGIRPSIPVREAIEFSASLDVGRGFQTGVFNLRGAYGKSLYEGGKQERELASKFEKYSKGCEARWPYTAAALQRIADRFLDDAKQEDERAKLRD